jgi:transcription antitermination factor NusG
MKNWYVLNTKPKKEAQVERLFNEGGFKIYFPKYKDGDRLKPFFPGYGFILFDFPAQYQMVKYTRGIKKLVGNQEQPIPIPETVIKDLRNREVDGYLVLEKYEEEPEIGDEIEVKEGPMKGLRGIFSKELTDNDRVLILLNYMSYQAQLKIEKKKLKKIQ